MDFLNVYIKPLLLNKIIRWDTNSTPHYQNSYMYLATKNALYSVINNTYYKYQSRTYKRDIHPPRFSLRGEEVTLPPQIESTLTYVDIARKESFFQLLCTSNMQAHGTHNSSVDITNFYSFYGHLPPTIQYLCGEIKMPNGGGTKLLHQLQTNDTVLVGMSDASLKEDKCSHAWILSTGNPDYITDPDLCIHGGGPLMAPQKTYHQQGENYKVKQPWPSYQTS
jgi:hypothetical protein